MRATDNRLSKTLTKEAGARQEDNCQGAGLASAGNSSTHTVPWGLPMNMIDSRTWCHRRRWSWKQKILLISWQIILFLALCCFDLLAFQGTQESLPAPQFKSIKEIKPVNFGGNQPWILFGRTDAETPMLWPTDVNSWLIVKRPWFWERLRAGREGGDRGWDGWMASLTGWTESEPTPGDGER